MKDILKKLTAALLLLAMLASLASCEKKGGDAPHPGGEGTDILTDTAGAENTGSTADALPPVSDDGEQGSGAPQEETQSGESASGMVRPKLLALASSEHYEDEWEGDMRLCYTSWSDLLLTEGRGGSLAGRETYPKLAAALEAVNASNGELGDAAELASWASDDLKSGAAEYLFPYYTEREYSVFRADERALSVLERYSAYMGGAHPNSFYEGMNFDPATGEKLTLDDVFADIPAMLSLLAEKLDAKYKDALWSPAGESMENYYENDYFSWTMDYQGVTFWFSPYELASYADGLLTATILFAEAPELFDAQYPEVPASYAMQLGPWAGITLDIDGDAQADSIAFGGYQTNEYDYMGFGVTVNGEYYAEDMFSFAFDPWLIHTADGRNYLYVISLTENDFKTLYVYSLADKALTFVDCLYGTGRCREAEEDGSYHEELITDPGCFRLNTRIDLLSTMGGARTYRTDEATGMPTSDEPYALNAGMIELKTLAPLTVSLPEDGGKRAELPVGAAMRPVFTDNDRWMDMTLDDGTVCRIELAYDEYNTVLIGGMPFDEVLDGCMFAG